MECALHYHQHLTETTYLTTTCHKTLLSFGPITYRNLHPVGFGTTVLCLPYSRAKAGSAHQDVHAASRVTRASPQPDFSKAVVDLMMQSQAAQRKENKPLLGDLRCATEVCRTSAINFSRETEMASHGALHEKSFPFQIKLLLIKRQFLQAGGLISKGLNNKHS